MSAHKAWFISETNQPDALKKTAGVKARVDAERVFLEEGLNPVNIGTDERSGLSYIKKIIWHFRARLLWESKTKCLKSGDILFCQFPLSDHTVFLSGVFKKLKNRGVKIVALIHDLDLFRTAIRNSGTDPLERFRIRLESRQLRYMKYFITHNEKMNDFMIRHGFEKENLITLGLFDYLYDANIGMDTEGRIGKDKPVIIAGALRPYKAGYVYKLPGSQDFALYGVGYTGDTSGNADYRGAFEPEELPFALSGSFGLVWDGNSTETCEGVFGEYLRINNPHKVSLYLASGIPVIIWEEAALAAFIEKEKCGFSVKRLEDISYQISHISDEEYEEMCRNAKRVGENLRTGMYLKKAVSEAMEKIGNEGC